MGASNNENTSHGLTHYLSPIEVLALSLGCAVGWGAFIMPGTTFLPLAGPVGTALGIGIGALIMLIIGVNYHFLMNKYPDAGGTLTYSIRAFGFDHGLLSAWFLLLVYIAIMWANATAIVLIVRNLFGSALQWGFHYMVAGYHVYFGEILLTLAFILLFGFICIKNKHIAIIIQTVMVIVMVCGIVICAFVILFYHGGLEKTAPAFSPSGENLFLQVLNIAVLAPWAFVGFESISNSTQGFNFSPKKSLKIMSVALILGALCYILLALMASSTYPAQYSNWFEYIHNLSRHDDISSIPTFYAAITHLGYPGQILLALSVLGGIVTGLIGNYIAASRLLFAMTEDNILPGWFGELDKNHTPSNALKFLIGISIFVPFVGRAAIGWIVDISTIGALIAYTYTSAAAFKIAKKDKNKPVQITGITGAIISLIFLLYFMIPNIFTVSGLSAESYMILIFWSIIGFLFFYIVFNHDTENRFGKTTIVWITLLFLVFFTSILWLRQATRNATERVLSDLSDYHSDTLEEYNITLDLEDIRETDDKLKTEMDTVNDDFVQHSCIQMAIIMISLFIMFKIYSSMTEREKKIETKRIKAEESNRAKSIFLSNMSHDIRTPMNAIIGYISVTKKLDGLPPEAVDYLEKIEFSSNHLLSLINDILDMSRIENGKLELCPVKTDLSKALSETYYLFETQMKSKHLDFKVDSQDIVHKFVMCDVKRLNRVLLNLVSNAYKYTPEGGSVDVYIAETSSTEDTASYELKISDTGIGMSPEFAKKVFDAYSRDKNASEIQGTGLGMAITKSIVDLMGGTISVQTEIGQGSCFTVCFSLPLALDEPNDQPGYDEPDACTITDFTGIRLLLVEDNEINRDIASLILEDAGFILSIAENGKEAYEAVAASAPGDLDAVLMDVQMPEMNGYEATRAIRAIPDKTLASIPIIAMTANAFADDVQNAKDAGMNGHIAKPIDIDNIKEELSKVLSKKGGQNEKAQ